MHLKSLEFKADAVSIKDRTFTGYASTWDVDYGGDLIVKGAFAKTLKEAGSRVKVLWQHYEPIGVPTHMEEDTKGLLVTAKVSKTRLGDEALELLADKVIDRMSIGYRIPEGKSEYNSDGVRVIKELQLLEFSLVTFPMNDAAIVTGVKTVRDMLSCKNRIDPAELKQLNDMVDELNALLHREPSKGTRGGRQPQNDIAALSAAIDNWGN
ncbi:MAG: HK97 family phage prohead protease [Planctomycetes bacterium]|nr:HK97 family phage prohead protease [Planctomycetota bacterium]